MFEWILNQLQTWLGLGREISDVGAIQMAFRTIIIYAFTLLIVRLGSKRFLSGATAFDVVVGIILGTVMSSAINGSAPFFPTLLAGVALVGMHWLFTMLAFRFDWFGALVKGSSATVIEDGKIQKEAVRQAGLSEHDLKQALRAEGEYTDYSEIKRARLERSGKISVLPFPPEPRVFDVSVADGVQIVRVRIE